MDRDALIEQAAAAYREQRPNGALADAPAWHDLDAEGRRAAHDRALATRTIEAALAPDGYSSTVRAVLARLR